MRAQPVSQRPGRGGPPRDGLLAAAPALGIDRVAAPGACSGQRNGTTLPGPCLLPGPRAGLSTWLAGRRRRRRPARPRGPGPSSLSCPSGLATGAAGSDPAEQLQQHAAAGQHRTGAAGPRARASRRSSSAVLSVKAGISPSGGQPVPAQGVPVDGSAGSWKNTCRRSRRSLRITHSPLCCAAAGRRPSLEGFSAGAALPYQSPPIFTPRSAWIFTWWAGRSS